MATAVSEVAQGDVVEVVIALAPVTVQVNVLLLVQENVQENVVKVVLGKLIDDLFRRFAKN